MVLAAMWGPGYTSFTACGVSISCISGGLVLWFWILQRTHEKQTVMPYESRPPITLKTKGKEKDIHEKRVLDWFKRTELQIKNEKLSEKSKVLICFLIYCFSILLTLASIHSEAGKDYVAMIYASSIVFYVIFCVFIPIYGSSRR
jgi:uncharacterized membrane protein